MVRYEPGCASNAAVAFVVTPAVLLALCARLTVAPVVPWTAKEVYTVRMKVVPRTTALVAPPGMMELMQASGLLSMLSEICSTQSQVSVKLLPVS